MSQKYSAEFLRRQREAVRALLADIDATEARAAARLIKRYKPNGCPCLGPDPCQCGAPSATEVIEACRVALVACVEEIEDIGGADDVPDCAHDALALIAKWKEGRG